MVDYAMDYGIVICCLEKWWSFHNINKCLISLCTSKANMLLVNISILKSKWDTWVKDYMIVMHLSGAIIIYNY